MDRKYNAKLVPLAKELRKNMTKEERHLWYDFLRHHPMKITRQKVLGRFIADFYCANTKIVIELDGSQHYEPEEKAKDQLRTDFLRGYGISVLRIPNNAVNQNFAGVCEYIDAVLTGTVAFPTEEEQSSFFP